MLGSVRTENEEQILRWKGQNRGAGQRYRNQAFPPMLGIEREGKRLPNKSPLQVHSYLTVMTHKCIISLFNMSIFLFTAWWCIRLLIAMGDEYAFRSMNIMLMDQKV